MTLDEFDAFWEEMIVGEKELLMKKGQEYSGKENRFRNFEMIGEELGMDPKKILWVYLHKHMDGIRSYLRGEYTGIEPIKGRIMDARNYLALLAGIIQEEEENTPA
jgi:hypothetical protein